MATIPQIITTTAITTIATPKTRIFILATRVITMDPTNLTIRTSRKRTKTWRIARDIPWEIQMDQEWWGQATCKEIITWEAINNRIHLLIMAHKTDKVVISILGLISILHKVRFTQTNRTAEVEVSTPTIQVIQVAALKAQIIIITMVITIMQAIWPHLQEASVINLVVAAMAKTTITTTLRRALRTQIRGRIPWIQTLRIWWMEPTKGISKHNKEDSRANHMIWWWG